MTTFTYWKGIADVATGIVLLTKPEIIYHSSVAKSSMASLTSDYRILTLRPGASSAHKMLSRSWYDIYIALLHIKSNPDTTNLQVDAIGLGHVRVSQDRASIPSLIVMNAAWSVLALSTVSFRPYRATSALLMTGINHFVFASVMFLRSKMTFGELVGLQQSKMN